MAAPIRLVPPESERAPMLRAQVRRRRGSVLDDHSARVRVLRTALPAGIALLMLLLVGWIVGRSVVANLAARKPAPSTIHMVKPRFYGRDDRGRPFQLTAVSAVRDNRDANQVQMERPVFILQTGDPRPSTLTSLSGLYLEDTRNLILAGQVVMDDSSGYHFESERALIDTATGNTTGETPIHGSSELGQIAASSYALYDHGAHMVFKGAVKAHLNNDSNAKTAR